MNIAKIISLLAILLFANIATATSHRLTPARLAELLEETKNQFFARELKDVRILITHIPKRERKATFFQVKPKLNITIFRKPSKRVYLLQVNPSIFQNSPSELAIRGILIHELSHIIDYLKLNTSELLLFGLRYALGRAHRFKYERLTDKRALTLGREVACSGIHAYRLWLYAQISPKEAEIKKKMYLTPEEIESYCQKFQ
jgi:hypothetical protein